jgi:hypothetical protein
MALSAQALHLKGAAYRRYLVATLRGIDMDALVTRIKEPSTWAGIAAVALALQGVFASGHVTTAAIVAAVGGALASVMGEKSP